MATIKGKWVFDETVNYIEDNTYPIEFISDGGNYVGFKVYRMGTATIVDFVKESGDTDYAYDVEWLVEARRTVYFGSTDQTVSDDFYTWFTANAVQEATPDPTPTEDTVYIKYNNETINSITKGQTCTLQCKTPVGKATQMLSDIDVEFVAGSGGSGATVYSIDWDYSGLDAASYISYYVFGAPTSIAEGQTVLSAMFLTSAPLDIQKSNCDVSAIFYTVSDMHLPTGKFSGYITILEVSNPTDDINIAIFPSSGGSN